MSKQYSVVANIVAKTEGFVKGLNEAKSKANEFHKGFENKTKALQQGLDKTGKFLMKNVTVPITALGTAAGVTFAKFESQMSKVQAVTGATGAEFKALTEQAKELGRTTQFSASEAAEGMEYLARAGFKSNEIMSSMPALLDLAASSAMDLGSAADITSNIMSGFGIEASEASRVADVLAKTAASANTDVYMLGEAMKYAAPVASSLGISMEEASAAIGFMSDAGIQASQAGTTLRTALLRLTDPSGEAAKALEKIGLNAFDSEGKMKPLSQIVSELEEGMEGWTEQQKASTLATIFGTEAVSGMMAVLERGGDELASFTKELENSEGTASEMAKVMNDNVAGAFKSLFSALEGLAISFGNILAPKIRLVADWLTELSRKFNELDDSTKSTIVNIALVVVAIAPLLLAGSKLISTLGLIGTGIKFLTPLFGGLLAPILAIVAGITALTIGGVALVNHLKKDAIPAVDLFGKEVSNTTKEVVGGFLELNDKATQALQQLSWSGQNVTKEMKDSIVTNISEMGNQIVQGLNGKKDEAVNVMQELFAKSTEFSEEEQRQLIENVTVSYEERTAKVQEGEQRIKEILELASEENRALKESEKAEINRIQDEMVQVGIEVLTENQREQQVILERMKQQAGEITAQQAVEVVKNSLEQKEKVVAEAEEQYNKSIAEIIKLRDEAGVISEEQAQKLIDEATRQRDETVRQAEDMHEKVVAEAKAQADEHVNKVDWETGEVLSKWQVFVDNIAIKYNNLVQTAKEKWDELWTSTQEFVTRIIEYPINKFEEMRIAVTNKMQEVRSNIEAKWQEAEDYLKNIKLLQVGKDIISGLIKGITSKFTDVKKKVEELASNLPSWMKKMLGIRSPARVMIPIGEFVAEGVAVGIDRGTKKYVAFSVDNMIKAITDPVGKIKSLADDIVQIFRESYKNQLKIKNHELEKQRLFHEQSYRETLNSIDKELQLYEDAHNQKMSLLDEEMDEYEECINQKLRMMELQEKEDDYQKQLSKEQETLSKLQSELNKRLLDDSLASRNKQRKLEEQIRLQQNKIEEMQNKRSQELRKETLKEMLENKKKETDATRNEADQQYQIVKNTAGKERNIATQQYEFQISLLEKERMQWEEHYDYLINSERHASDIRREIYQGNFEYIKQELQAIQALTMANQSIIGQANSENFSDRVSDTISNVDDTSKMKIFNQDDLYLYTAKFINDQLMNSNVTAGTKKALEKMRDTVVGWIGDRSSTFDPNNTMSFNAAYKQLSLEDKKMVANYLESFLLQQGRITDQANITTVKGLIDNLPRFHEGGFVGKIKNNVSNLHNMTKDFLQNREVLAVLEQDEFVLSKRMIESIQSNMNRQFNIPSKLATETIINNNTNNTIDLRFDKLIHVEGSIDSATIPKVESAINEAFEKLGRSYDVKGLSIRI